MPPMSGGGLDAAPPAALSAARPRRDSAALPVVAIGLLLVTVLATFLPGGLVTAAAGLRVPVAIATAPLVTYGLIAAASTLAIVVDVPWGPWFLLVEALLVAAVVGVLRRRAGRPRRRRRPSMEQPARGWRDLRRPRRSDLALAAGVTAGSLYSAAVLVRGFGDFGNVSQEWDNTFHANAVRFISESGVVDPYGLRFVNDWDSESFFYPNAFHALGAVVRDLTGAAVPPVLNGASLMIGVIAAVGLAVLLREIGAPTVVSATAPVLLAGFTSFPYDVIWRGPVLPYATGLALLPAFLLLIREVLARADLRRATLAGLGGAALFGLQPATALTGAAFAVVFLVATWVRRGRPDVRALALLAAAGGLSLVVAAPIVLASVRTGTSVATVVDWPPVQTPGQAIGDLLFLNHAMDDPQWTLAALIVVGLFSLRSARYMWWWLGCGALGAWFFVLASSYDSGLAEAVTQPWWNDRWRFIAIAVLGLAALAAHGLWRVSIGVEHLLARAERRTGRRLLRPGLAGGLVFLAVFVASGALYQDRNSDLVADTYQETDYLSEAEEAGFAWLAERVSDGEMVMNDPGDGSSFMYALAGVRPVFGHQVPEEGYELRGHAQRAFFERFRCLDSDPVVRQTIDDLDIRYVFLGAGFLRDKFDRIPGLRLLAPVRQLELVYQQDGVKIYEVAGQPEPDRALASC
jgi:hypothetical protein